MVLTQAREVRIDQGTETAEQEVPNAEAIEKMIEIDLGAEGEEGSPPEEADQLRRKESVGTGSSMNSSRIIARKLFMNLFIILHMLKVSGLL